MSGDVLVFHQGIRSTGAMASLTHHPDVLVPDACVVETELVRSLAAFTLYNFARKGRRAPKAEVSLPGVPLAFSSYFDVVGTAGVKYWRPVVRAARCKTVKEFWTYNFDAARQFCSFEQFEGEQNLKEGPQVPGQVAVFSAAYGNMRLTSSGDMVVLLPPFHVRFVRTYLGPSKVLFTYKMKITFSIGVVSATPTSPLRMHPLYPRYNDASRWIQMPLFADPVDHYMRGIQQSCSSSNLDCRALAVQAALHWNFDILEQPNPNFENRPADSRATNGLVCNEASLSYMPARSKKDKFRVITDNTNYRKAIHDKALTEQLFVVILAHRRDAKKCFDDGRIMELWRKLIIGMKALCDADACVDAHARGDANARGDADVVAGADAVAGVDAVNGADCCTDTSGDEMEDVTPEDIKWLLDEARKSGDFAADWVYEARDELRASGRWLW